MSAITSEEMESSSALDFAHVDALLEESLEYPLHMQVEEVVKSLLKETAENDQVSSDTILDNPSISARKCKYVYTIQGGDLPATPENLLLLVKISPKFEPRSSWSYRNISNQENMTYGEIISTKNLFIRLKQAEYLEDSLTWLFQKKIISKPPKCRDHYGLKVLAKEPDIQWLCLQCYSMNVSSYPLFFKKLDGYALRDILALIMHWVSQSDLNHILSDLSLGIKDIWHMWTTMQQACSASLQKLHLVIPYDSIQEAAMFSMGPFLLIAIMDRTSLLTKSEVIAFTRDAETIINHINELFDLFNCSSWIISDCSLFYDAVIVYSNLRPSEQPRLKFEYVDSSITDPKSGGNHNLNVRGFFIKLLSENFGKFDFSTLTLDIMKSYVAEFHWRERYGKNCDMSFWNFMYQLVCDGEEKPTQAAVKKDTSVVSNFGVPVLFDNIPEPHFLIPATSIETISNSTSDGNCSTNELNSTNDCVISVPKDITKTNDIQPMDSTSSVEVKVEKDDDDDAEKGKTVAESNGAGSSTSSLFDQSSPSLDRSSPISSQNGNLSISKDSTSLISTPQTSSDTRLQNFAIILNSTDENRGLSSLVGDNSSKSSEDMLPMLNIKVEPTSSEKVESTSPEKVESTSPEKVESTSPEKVEDSSEQLETQEIETPEESAENTSDMPEEDDPSTSYSDIDISSNVTILNEGIKTVSILNLLEIQTWPLVLELQGKSKVEEVAQKKSLELFKEKLILDGYFKSSLQWLVRNDLFHYVGPCKKCKSLEFRLVEGNSNQHTDKASWKCLGCELFQPYKRLKFFSLFGFSISIVAHLLYHWAVQTPIHSVLRETTLNEYKIRYIYWAIQRLCSTNVLKPSSLLGGVKRFVELDIAIFGRFCIVGALDRDTNIVRMRVIPAPSKYVTSLFESIFMPWIEPMTVVVTSYNRCYLFEDKQLKTVTDEKPEMLNTNRISKFLQKMVSCMFGQYSTAGLKMEMIQAFLDEILWRQIFGTSPENAFWSLLYQIAADDGIDLSKRGNNWKHPRISNEKIQMNDASSNTPTSDVSTSDVDLQKFTKTNIVKVSEAKPAPAEVPTTNSKDSQKDAMFEIQCLNGDVSKKANNAEEPVNVIQETVEDHSPVTSSFVTCNDGSDVDDPMKCTEEDDKNTEGATLDLVCIEEPQIIYEHPAPHIDFLNDDALQDDDIDIEGLESSEEPTNIWDNRMMTVGKGSTLLLKPVLKDYMFSFRPLRNRKHVLKTAPLKEKIMALDEYYFARKKPTKVSNADRNYVYCCTICKLYFFSNIDIINHTMGHAEEKRKQVEKDSASCNCPHCMMSMESKDALKIHMTLIHDSDNSLTCLICSELFSSNDGLISHMQYTHVCSDMPYACGICQFRSSLHKESIDHFFQEHKGEAHLLCPFCLKICSPRAKTDEILYTQTYYQHLVKHLTAPAPVNCASCTLVFFSLNDVKAHILKDHISFVRDKDVIPFKARRNPVILVHPDKWTLRSQAVRNDEKQTLDNVVPEITVESPISEATDSMDMDVPSVSSIAETSQRCSSPEISVVSVTSDAPPLPIPMPEYHVSPTKSIKIEPEPKTVKTPEAVAQQSDSKLRRLLLSDDASPVSDYSRIMADSNCIECGDEIVDGHFYKILNCNCKYSTQCAKAFVNHMVSVHGILKSQKEPVSLHLRNVAVSRNCLCSCGFSSNNGNFLASHLKRCVGGSIRAGRAPLTLKASTDKKFMRKAKAVPSQSTRSTSSTPSSSSPAVLLQPDEPSTSSTQSAPTIEFPRTREVIVQSPGSFVAGNWVSVPQPAPQHMPNFVTSAPFVAPQTYSTRQYLVQDVFHPQTYPSHETIVPTYGTEVLPGPPIYYKDQRIGYVRSGVCTDARFVPYSVPQQQQQQQVPCFVPNNGPSANQYIVNQRFPSATIPNILRNRNAPNHT